jgi:hypothetical protein
MAPITSAARSRQPRASRRMGALLVASVIVYALVPFSAAAAIPAKAAVSTQPTLRFVNMAVTSKHPDGTPIDIYISTSVTSQPSEGGKITAVKPAPKKLVPKLAFGTATKYLALPYNSVLWVTATGSTDILAMGGLNALPGGKGSKADTAEISSNGGAIFATGSTTTTESSGYTSPLSMTQYEEPNDYTYTDGTGLPIKNAAVLLTHTSGITGGTADDQWQMGVVGKGCLPEYLSNGNADSSYNPEYLAPGSGGNGIGIEYVASDAGDLQLALWTGDQADCSGTPAVTAPATVTAGNRYYLYWYGPASSPKLLVVPLAGSPSKKFATNSSPDAYTGGSGSGASSSSTTTSTSTSTSTTSTSTP